MNSLPHWHEPLERAVRNPELARGIFCEKCQAALLKDGTTEAWLYHIECLERLADHLSDVERQ